jgi:hypothetical protein
MLLKHMDAKPVHHLDYEEVMVMCKRDEGEGEMTDGEVHTGIWTFVSVMFRFVLFSTGESQ